jgi:hypothetical protein
LFLNFYQIIRLQGYGRHSEKEVVQIGKDDLKALNDYIDNKKYFMGDQATDIDACIFGMICQFIYHDKGPLNIYIKSKLKKFLTGPFFNNIF